MVKGSARILGTLTRLVRDSPFLRNNAIFFFGTLLVSVLNYLLYPILGRILEPAQFGEVQALLSIYAQGAIFLTILTYVTIHITVNSKDSVERNNTLLSLERFALIFGFLVLAIGMLLANQLKEFLNFHEVMPFIILMISLALTIPLTLRMSYLRGRKQFLRAILTDGIGSFSKLLIAPVLILIGLGTTGAIFGLAISQVISLCFAVAWAIAAGLKGFGLRSADANMNLVRPQLKYALYVFIATFAVTSLFSLDIIAIKHYFSPDTAGMYAGISTIARIVYFVTAPLTGVLITMVSLKQPIQKNRMQLVGTLGLICLVGSIVLLFFTVFPEFVITILVGSKYLEFAGLLSKLSLVMLILSLANASLLYNVAMRRYVVAILATIPIISTIALVYWNNAQMSDIVNDVLIGSSGLLILTAGFTALDARISTKKVHG